MDMSLFRFNDDTNTVEILTPGHNQTIEALEFLVKKKLNLYKISKNNPKSKYKINISLIYFL